MGVRADALRGRDRGLQQTAMAGQLGISPSYLNHLERNQRPVTAAILLRLAQHFEVDIRSFASDGGEQGSAEQLSEVFADPMFSDLQIGRQEIIDAEAIARDNRIARLRSLRLQSEAAERAARKAKPASKARKKAG